METAENQITKDAMDKEKVRETLRQKKNRKRKQVVLIQKLSIAAVVLALVGGGIYWYNQLPEVRVDKCISQAKEYEAAEDYTNALASYEEALKIESTTVKAYRYMANLYLEMKDYQAAEEILYKGLEETQDAEIEETYHTVMLNESVYDINDENCDFTTVNRILNVLESDSDKTSAYELLHTCYDRLIAMTDEKGVNPIYSMTEEGFGYEAYQAVVERMLSIYEANQKPEMEELLLKYIAPQSETITIPMEYFDSYLDLIEKTDALVFGDGFAQLQACLNKCVEVKSFFAPYLTEFEAGNYEVARDLLVSDEYVEIRDAFIEETMDYWNGKTYVPVSDIAINLHYADGHWSFSFVDEENEPAKHGYIKVWGFKWLDNGYQRTAISYVPVSENEEYYPMTEYCMMYWWSTPINRELTENTYARMNFRFEENIYTEDGKTTKAINDWGGKYEYKDTYE